MLSGLSSLVVADVESELINTGKEAFPPSSSLHPLLCSHPPFHCSLPLSSPSPSPLLPLPLPLPHPSPPLPFPSLPFPPLPSPPPPPTVPVHTSVVLLRQLFKRVCRHSHFLGIQEGA